jgi:hypothetical protein
MGARGGTTTASRRPGKAASDEKGPLCYHYAGNRVPDAGKIRR